jgi:excisionase family DNA binding protein
MEHTSGQRGIKAAYSVSEAAALLGLHPGTVSGFIKNGELRAARLGHRTIRITHEALMDFLRQKEEESMRELRGKAAGKKKSRGP